MFIKTEAAAYEARKLDLMLVRIIQLITVIYDRLTQSIGSFTNICLERKFNNPLLFISSLS
jgi:hypothetical protein